MTTETKRPPAKPLPVLLTAADAMLFAADNLDNQVSNLELMAIIAEVFNKPTDNTDKPLTDENRKALDDLRVMSSSIVDKDIQVAAMRAAAKDIRALAHETKLADARAASRGISVTV